MAIKVSETPHLSEDEIQRAIASDPDNPELTDEQLANAKPFRAAFPDLTASIDKAKKRGRPAVAAPRQQISVRLDPDLIAYYKNTGRGWQGRMNDDLRKLANLK